MLNHWIRGVCIVCVYVAYLSITDVNCKTIQDIARTPEDLEKSLVRLSLIPCERSVAK